MRWRPITIERAEEQLCRSSSNCGWILGDYGDPRLEEIGEQRLKAGRLEAERRRVPGLVDFIATNEPRLVAFNEYVNDEGTEVGVVQVRADTNSFEFHMGVVRERAARAYEETLDNEHPSFRRAD